MRATPLACTRPARIVAIPVNGTLLRLRTLRVLPPEAPAQVLGHIEQRVQKLVVFSGDGRIEKPALAAGATAFVETPFPSIGDLRGSVPSITRRINAYSSSRSCASRRASGRFARTLDVKPREKRLG